MKTTREKNPLALGLFCAALLAGHGAGAQVFPNKPLRIIVPAPPGNTSDAAVRLIGQKMSVPLGQPVVVENRAGASGSIGTNAGLRAAPDGYTLTMISSTSTVAAMHLIKNLSVNNIYLQIHFAERDDASREMIEREEAAIELLIAHQ